MRVNYLSWNVLKLGESKLKLSHPNAEQTSRERATYDFLAAVIALTEANLVGIMEVSHVYGARIAAGLQLALRQRDTSWYVESSGPANIGPMGPTATGEAYLMAWRANSVGMPIQLPHAQLQNHTMLAYAAAANTVVQFPSAEAEGGGRAPCLIAFQQPGANAVRPVAVFHACKPGGRFTHLAPSRVARLEAFSRLAVVAGGPQVPVDRALLGGDFNLSMAEISKPLRTGPAQFSTISVSAKTTLKMSAVQSSVTDPLACRKNPFDHFASKVVPEPKGSVVDVIAKMADPRSPAWSQLPTLFSGTNWRRDILAGVKMKAADFDRATPVFRAWATYRWLISDHLPILLQGDL